MKPSQNSVSVTVTTYGQSGVSLPVRGLLKPSMKIRNNTAIAAAKSCAIYCGRALKSYLSSRMPTTNRNAPPISSPTSRITSLSSVRTTGKNCATITAAVNATYIARPPNLDVTRGWLVAVTGFIDNAPPLAKPLRHRRQHQRQSKGKRQKRQ